MSAWRHLALALVSILVGVASLDAQTSWTQLSPSGGPPAARNSHTSVIDPVTDRMVVFGGNWGDNQVNDTWVLTNADGLGGTPAWTQLSPTGGPPPARSEHSAVYDVANNRMTVFAGNGHMGYCDGPINDVWVLANANGLGGTPTWTQLSPTGPAPAPRTMPRSVYDPGSNRMIEFGGHGSAGCSPVLYNDVWVLTNANGLGGTPVWIRLAPSGDAPIPREGAVAVYDPASNRLIVTGGSQIDDVWVLTNANGLGGAPAWLRLSPAGTHPLARAHHSGAYDVDNNRLIVFAGQTALGFANDVWVLANANGLGGVPTWSQASPSGGPPGPRMKTSAVYDSSSGSRRLVVFAGQIGWPVYANDVWVLADPPAAGAFQFSSPTYAVAESAGVATITVTRTGSAGAVTVDYATSDGSAVAGGDYVSASGTLTFAPGETSKVFSVFILNDSLAESNETVNLTLTSPTGGAVLGSPASAVLTILDPSQPALPSWSALPGMNARRADHSATLLPNGKVLVAGGRLDQAGTALATAELYDPATGTWTPTGSMKVSRQAHSATLLPNGQVLVAGGLDVWVTRSSAELYDPATGTWTLTGTMAVARQAPKAVLLPNGKVLVHGGSGHSGSTGWPIFSSELYDPATRTWSSAGSAAHSSRALVLLSSGKVLGLAGDPGTTTATDTYDWTTNTWAASTPTNVARFASVATLLPNGKVLLVGGAGVGGGILTSAELFDPAGNGGAGSWSLTGSTSAQHSFPILALLPNGQVLLAGGVGPVTTAELYDPATGTWSVTAPLGTGSGSSTATVLPSGKVLVAGGDDSSGFMTSRVELYDPAVASWSATGSLGGPRQGATTTRLASGAVLAAGGTGVSGPLASAERFDPMGGGGAGAWTATGSLSAARSAHTATLLADGRVLAAGGSDGSGVLTSAEVFDPAGGGGAGSWASTGSLATARSSHTATFLLDGRVLVAGGTGASGALTSAEVFDPAAGGGSGSWSPTGALLDARANHTATLLADGRVLVAGGSNGGGVLASAEIFDPVTGAWTHAGRLGAARQFHTATLLPNGLVLVAGGLGDVGQYLSSAELFDPTTETWTDTDSLAIARYGHTATLLSTGQVLVANGYDGGLVVDGEIYDPGTGRWSASGALGGSRQFHGAALLADGRVLLAGGSDGSSPLATSQTFAQGGYPSARRSVITGVSETLSYGSPLAVQGTGFRGDSEASSGTYQSSSVRYPLVQLRSLASGAMAWIVPDARANFWDDPMTVMASRLPDSMDTGWHQVTVFTAGVPSVSAPVQATCSVVITTGPSSQAVAVGSAGSFQVESVGARSYQWYRNGAAILGATASSYTTPPVVGADSGTVYQVEARGMCWRPADTCTAGTGTHCALSTTASLTVGDSSAPAAAVLSPSGGEYWLLSSASPASTELVTWTMSDDIRICQVEVSLWYSADGGATYQLVPVAANFDPSNVGGGGAKVFGSGGECAYPGEGTTSVPYTLPTTFPSGASGSLYKVQVRVTDHSGLQTAARSPNPFYIVQSNPDSVRTLIFSNTARMQSRMGITVDQAAALDFKLQELAENPKVLGRVVDLNGVTDLTALYAAWDADTSNPDNANNILFGCHGPSYPAGCPTDRDRNGIHDEIRSLLAAYTGVRYLVLVGDDRVIPMARIADHALLLTEPSYTAGSVDLTPDGTTVGQALTANKYLSDDPLAVLDPVRPDELSGNLFLPDLAVGRLVETPSEITTAIATFIGQDGVLDLSVLDPSSGHKVLMTAYDFLRDSAGQIRTRWKSAFGDGSGDASLAPVDGSLISQGWDDTTLRTHLAGNGGTPYGVMSLNEHATHYAEGAPGADFRFGLGTLDIAGADACGNTSPSGSLGLAGSVIYAVGCHAGLSVPGSCTSDAEHSLDLPESFLSRGVVTYVANSGYGWGLKYGVGYSEHLVKLLTEEMTKGGTVVVGDAVRATKQEYYLATPRYDSYDEKSLMEWTLYGLPMYAVKTGIATTSASAFSGPAPALAAGTTTKTQAGVSIASTTVSAPLPNYLTDVSLHFDFGAGGVYKKFDSQGNDITATNPSGCPDTSGCYYDLNGLSSGNSDLPIQPYFIYDSRLSGTSQHGVLWKGGTYEEESGWAPILAELVSNGGDGSDHGSLPKKLMTHTISQRVVPGHDPETCRPSDTEVSSTLVNAGEALKANDLDPTYSIERHYKTVDLEAFYFDDTVTPGNNCDRAGPVLGTPPFNNNKDYHQASPGMLSWAVPATDVSGVWRVIVVVNDNTTSSGQGAWVPVELAYDSGTGMWEGSRAISSSQATYVIEAVDNRGNVTWLDYSTSAQAGPSQSPSLQAASRLPSSGVDFGIPELVDVAVPAPAGLAITGFTPASGPVGTTVAIIGTGFTDATVVAFGGPPAPFVILSDSTIYALVPQGAVSGRISVTTPAGTAVSAASFTVGSPPGPPSLTIDDVSVAEGSTATFTVTLSAAADEEIMVGYATADGTATAGSGYTTVSGTLTFTPGTTTQQIQVPTLADTAIEGTETFFVDLSNATNATIEKAQGQGSILDGPSGQSFAFASGTFASTSTSALISVRRSGGTEGTATVHYRTSDGTASAGIDYQATSGALTFPPGVGTRSFTVPVLASSGSTRTALLELRDPAGAVLGSQSTAVLTIGGDTRTQTLRFVTSTPVVKESAVQAVVAVTRTGGRRGSVSVDYAASGGTAIPSTDYTSVSGTLDFPDGVQIRTFTVPILDDHVVDDDKTVGLTLSNPSGASLGSPASSTLTIQSDDPTLSFSAASYQTSQTAGSALITVERRGPRTSSVSVGYETSGGTATPGTDYTAVSGTLDFAPGVLVRSFTVPILNDPTPKSDRTVGLTLLSPSPNAGLGVRSTATLLIGTDDPQVFFSKESYQVTESASQALITVARTGATGRAVGVSYQTSAGTATPGEDYLDVSGTLAFPARVVKQSFAVPILPGANLLGGTVNLELSAPTGGAVLGTPETALLTIVEDEQAGSVGFAVSDFSVSETGPTATVTVVRTGGAADGVSVDYATSDGTALDGENYLQTSGRLTFADGEMSKSFTIPVLDDGAPGENLTVTLTLSSPTGGLLLGSRSTATLWIVEDR